MVIDKLRQNARREAEQKRAEEEAKAAKRLMRRNPLKSVLPAGTAAHPLFVPTLTVWGAAVLGLCVMVLSSVTIARISMFAGLGALGSLAQLLYAGLAAVIGAGIAFVAASFMARSAPKTEDGAEVASMAGRRVQPIDPALELGSESLDAPIVEIPFAAPEEDAPQDNADEVILDLLEADESDGDEPLELDEASEIGEDPDQMATEEGVLELTQESETSDEPAELDLGPFTAGDEDDEDTLPSETTAQAEIEPATQARTGIEKLREASPQDLSLVQLVERFAAALHEVQDKAPSDLAALTAEQGGSERERALAEALKALSLFTQRGFNKPQPTIAADAKPERFGASFTGQAVSPSETIISETERDLREALSKLQNLRGAA